MKFFLVGRKRYLLPVSLLAVAIISLILIGASPSAAVAWNPKPSPTPDVPQFTQNPPHADAALCPTHNPMVWHGLWDSARGCHYDHEHKDNPGLFYQGMPEAERISAERLNALFGAPGVWFGGTSISYPWQTFMGASPDYSLPKDPSKVENTMKHAGYGWIARTNLPKRGGQYVSDFRLQYHAIFAAPGVVTRHHSYSLEVNVCNARTGCRIIQTGGWLDFGILRISGNRVDLPNQEGGAERQRLHRHYKDTTYATDEKFKTPAVWYGSMIHPEFVKDNYLQADTDRPFRKLTVALETYDVWSNAFHNDPYSNHFFCPDFDCNKNGTTLKMHRLTLDFVLEEGFAEYTDRFGRTNTTCTVIGLDCIPTRISAGTRASVAYNDQGKPREYDLSPAGVWWVKYPN